MDTTKLFLSLEHAIKSLNHVHTLLNQNTTSKILLDSHEFTRFITLLRTTLEDLQTKLATSLSHNESNLSSQNPIHHEPHSAELDSFFKPDILNIITELKKTKENLPI